MITETGKWKFNSEKSVRVCSFKIGIEETTLYHRDGKMGSCELINIDFRQILHSDSLEYIDPLALNKAMVIDMEFSPIHCQISKNQFTYLMKCMDLNINYDDGMKDLYDFKLKKEFTEINPIKEDYRQMLVKIKMPCISISCYFLNEFLAEIVCYLLPVSGPSEKNLSRPVISKLSLGQLDQATQFSQIVHSMPLILTKT